MSHSPAEPKPATPSAWAPMPKPDPDKPQ
jgi:hypothetical protein